MATLEPRRALDPTRGEIGWDGPVAIVLPGTVDWNKDAKTLAALIQAEAPVGRGPLKRDLSLRRGGYKRLPKPQIGFEATIHNAYANIQDQGGKIPERRPKGYTLASADQQRTIGDRAGKAMGWGGKLGGPHTNFAKVARAFTLPGKHYIQRGFERWIRTRGHGAAFAAGPTVRWARNTAEVSG